MESIFDWITVLTFCVLAVIYLQRSAADDPQDKVWHYLPPALGCAAANWLGDNVSPILGVVGLVVVLAYIHYVLRPQIRLGR